MVVESLRYATMSMSRANPREFTGVSITLNYDSVAEAQKIFDKLAASGKVTMAVQPTFWAKSFGMLVDKFGTPWIVNGELLPM